VSGRAILDALVAGQTDPEALAGLARMSLRRRTAELTLAPAGRFTAQLAFLVRLHLRVIDQLAANIAEITAHITEAVKPFQPTLNLLRTILGIGDRVAVTVPAEIGDDMSQFPTAGHLASWSGVCPGQHQSVGRTKQVSTRPGNNHPKAALGNAAMGATRTTDCYLQSRYRQNTRRPSTRRPPSNQPDGRLTMPLDKRPLHISSAANTAACSACRPRPPPEAAARPRPRPGAFATASGRSSRRSWAGR
jgi:transposase